MPLGQFRMIGFVNANQQGCRLSTGSRALVRWLAEFAPNSATFGDWPTNGSSSSRNNILRNRFFHEVIEIINEAAAQNTLEGRAGLERLRRVASRRSPTMTATPPTALLRKRPKPAVLEGIR